MLDRVKIPRIPSALLAFFLLALVQIAGCGGDRPGDPCEPGCIDDNDCPEGCFGGPTKPGPKPKEEPSATQQGLTACVTIQRGQASPWGTVADAPINAGAPTTNYGLNPAAAIGLVSGAQRLMLVRWDTSGIPSSATITSASVTLTAIAGSSAAATTLTAAPSTATWSESTATWATFGGAYGAALADTGASSGVAGSTITIAGTAPGLIAAVQGWTTTPSTNMGLVFDCGAGRCNPATSEQGTASMRPRLDVCYSTGAPPCTAPVVVPVAPTTLTYRPGLTINRYSPAAPSGAWIVVWHGGGGTSTTASKTDPNVVTVCGIAVAAAVTCYAVDYTPASSSTTVGVAFRDSLCAERFAAADAASLGLNLARGGVAGISWGGTLAAATAVYLRAGYTVPGSLVGDILPNGVDLGDPTCPTAPAAGDASLVQAAPLWYPILDWRSWSAVNGNGAAANNNLVINAAATSFTDPVYLPHATDLSALVYPHSTAATGITWSLAQGDVAGASFDGDGFVRRSTQAGAFDAAATVSAPACNHNFSPGAGDTVGGCQACAANKANATLIGAL